jgi:hypothetical protein
MTVGTGLAGIGAANTSLPASAGVAATAGTAGAADTPVVLVAVMPMQRSFVAVIAVRRSFAAVMPVQRSFAVAADAVVVAAAADAAVVVAAAADAAAVVAADAVAAAVVAANINLTLGSRQDIVPLARLDNGVELELSMGRTSSLLGALLRLGVFALFVPPRLVSVVI